MNGYIKPRALKPGDTIGIISPCSGMSEAGVAAALEGIKSRGYNYKLGKYVFSKTDGYAGSIEERAADFNDMIADPEVNMLLFPGGEISNEILPYIDYEAIRKNPKIICSYSDGTSIVEAVHYMTGLITFYSGSTRLFDPIIDYNMRSFESRLVTGDCAYEKATEWRVVRPGIAEGEIVAGYLWNFALLQNGGYYKVPEEKYILFIEDYESFSKPSRMSKFFQDMVQKGAFERATGLVFGHYSSDPEKVEKILPVLRRLGDRLNIPVVYTDDYGHGEYMSIFPIGVQARLDTSTDSFVMYESGVETK